MRTTITTALLASWLGTVAHGQTIHVELRSQSDQIHVGDTVDIGCYLVADDGPHEYCCTSLALGWDPAKLNLLGADPAGSAPSQLQFWPAPGAAYTLNESIPPQDGDGLYIVMAQLGTDQYATTEGTLITTFQFEAVSEGESLVSLDIVGPGIEDMTIVWDGVTPNTQVTGELRGLSVLAVDCVGGTPGEGGGCGGIQSGGPCTADLNYDGHVNVDDLIVLILHWQTGEADIDDFVSLIEQFGSVCP